MNIFYASLITILLTGSILLFSIWLDNIYKKNKTMNELIKDKWYKAVSKYDDIWLVKHLEMRDDQYWHSKCKKISDISDYIKRENGWLNGHGWALITDMEEVYKHFPEERPTEKELAVLGVKLEVGKNYYLESKYALTWLVRYSGYEDGFITGVSICISQSDFYSDNSKWGNVDSVKSIRLATKKESAHIQACIDANKYVNPPNLEEEWIPKKGDWVYILDTGFQVRSKGDIFSGDIKKIESITIYIEGYNITFEDGSGGHGNTTGEDSIKYCMRKALPHEIPNNEEKTELPNSAKSPKKLEDLCYPDVVHCETKEDYEKIFKDTYNPNRKYFLCSEYKAHFPNNYGSSDVRKSYEGNQSYDGRPYCIYEMDQIIFPESKSEESEGLGSLPEKWVVVCNSQNEFDVFKGYWFSKDPHSWGVHLHAKAYDLPYYGSYNGREFSYNGVNNWYFPEITFEQFKKWVLKEELVKQTVKGADPILLSTPEGYSYKPAIFEFNQEFIKQEIVAPVKKSTKKCKQLIIIK